MIYCTHHLLGVAVGAGFQDLVSEVLDQLEVFQVVHANTDYKSLLATSHLLEPLMNGGWPLFRVFLRSLASFANLIALMFVYSGLFGSCSSG